MSATQKTLEANLAKQAEEIGLTKHNDTMRHAATGVGYSIMNLPGNSFRGIYVRAGAETGNAKTFVIADADQLAPVISHIKRLIKRHG